MTFLWEETQPQPRLYECGHCGRMTGDYEGGSAQYNWTHLCHPNTDTRPDCYRLVSMEHHHVPCDHDECVADRAERGL